MELHIVILAAGNGSRMRSNTPKILHNIGGTPMFEHVVNTAFGLFPTQIHAIINNDSQSIQERFSHLPINWIIQQQQLGTGHAVRQALPSIPNTAHVLVLCADAPLLQTSTIKPLIDNTSILHDVNILVAKLRDPYGLGRIIRNESGYIIAIVEEKDASSVEKEINEIYTGICCVKALVLANLLPKLTNNNAQKEYYLTDIISMAYKENLKLHSITIDDNNDILGVNNRAQLQTVERIYQSRIAQKIMLDGVTVADANRIDIRGTLKCEKDVFIDINNLFKGNVSIGDNTIIEPNCILEDVVIGSNCVIRSNSVLEKCIIENNCEIGPFARIRPGTEIASDCKIGNFVEIKNTKIANKSKANHLSYLGDAIIGKKVNIGAGTITCNYDGANKHQTTIEDGVFIGSDTQIVAPLTIGENATIGAGSTIRKDVPPNELTLTASTQKVIYGWKRPEKKLEKEPSN